MGGGLRVHRPFGREADSRLPLCSGIAKRATGVVVAGPAWSRAAIRRVVRVAVHSVLRVGGIKLPPFTWLEAAGTDFGPLRRVQKPHERVAGPERKGTPRRSRLLWIRCYRRHGKNGDARFSVARRSLD